MNQQEFEAWKHHPTTKEVMQYVKDFRFSIMQGWAAGAHTMNTIEATTLKNVEALSKCQVCEDLVNLDYEDISQFYKENSHVLRDDQGNRGRSGKGAEQGGDGSGVDEDHRDLRRGGQGSGLRWPD